jgi:hypothetical protein
MDTTVIRNERYTHTQVCVWIHPKRKRYLKSTNKKMATSEPMKMATSAPMKMAGVGNGLSPAAAAAAAATKDNYRPVLSRRNVTKGIMQLKKAHNVI